MMAKAKASTKAKTAKKSPAKKSASKAIAYPGMMGDGTEEQNLSERGNPAARIKKAEVAATFGKPAAKAKPKAKTKTKAKKKKK
jgi:hypothetical protein